MNPFFKKTVNLILMVAMIFSIMLPVLTTRVNTSYLVENTEMCPQIALGEKAELIVNFDVIGENGSLDICLYDMDAETTDDVRSDAPNYLILSHSSCHLANENPDKKIRWSEKIDKTGDYVNKVDDNHVCNQVLPVGSGYVLKLNRWENRISVTITGPDDTVYWDVAYNAKADMAETIYFKLSPWIMTIDITDYKLGETESVKETKRSSGEGLLIICIIAGLLLLIALNVGSNLISKEIYSGTGFGFVTGGLWAVALVTAVAIPIPPLRKLYGDFIGYLLGTETVLLTDLGKWMWIIFGVCTLVSIVYLLIVLKYSSVNPVLTVLLMLVFGAIYLFTIGLIVSILFKTAALAIILLILLIGFHAQTVDYSNLGKKTDTETSSPQTLWGSDDNPFSISHGGEDYLYIYPSNGDNRNAIRVQKTDSGLYVDENGNYYNP